MGLLAGRDRKETRDRPALTAQLAQQARLDWMAPKAPKARWDFLGQWDRRGTPARREPMVLSDQSGRQESKDRKVQTAH